MSPATLPRRFTGLELPGPGRPTESGSSSMGARRQDRAARRERRRRQGGNSQGRCPNLPQKKAHVIPDPTGRSQRWRRPRKIVVENYRTRREATTGRWSSAEPQRRYRQITGRADGRSGRPASIRAHAGGLMSIRLRARGPARGHPRSPPVGHRLAQGTRRESAARPRARGKWVQHIMLGRRCSLLDSAVARLMSGEVRHRRGKITRRAFHRVFERRDGPQYRRERR